MSVFIGVLSSAQRITHVVQAIKKCQYIISSRVILGAGLAILYTLGHSGICTKFSR